MKKNQHLFHTLLFTICSFIISLYSCKDDFATDSSYHLTYSVDTLKFDTIFTEILTPTKIVKIYNRTDKDIHIDECVLHSAYHFFQINLNGKAGESFQNITLSKGDSLYLFVQLKIDEIGSDAPLYIEDYITFSYHSNLEKIVLNTYGQDVHLVRNQTISENTTWTNDKPYLIYDSLRIAENVTFTIEAGTRLYFHNNATIKVDGILQCKGLQDAPIIMRGDRNDMIEDCPYDVLSNQWGGIEITEKSNNNLLQYTYIRNGNFGIKIDSAAIDRTNPRIIIANSHIHNVDQQNLIGHSATVYAFNSIFSCGGNGCVVLQGGEYVFNHCTICNYSLGLTGTYANAVVLSDEPLFYSKGTSPIQAQFINCIIDGTKSNEVIVKSDDLTNDFQFLFKNCLIRYNDETEHPEILTGNHFDKIVWNGDPKFKKVDLNNFEFDFHIDSLSEARYQGYEGLYTLYPECSTDRDGIARPTDTLPDIGAYQWISSVVQEK